MGAATVSVAETAFGDVVAKSFGSPLKIVTGTITMNASYATGGDTCDLSAELADVKAVLISPAGGYVFQYVKGGTVAASKVKAYCVGSAGAMTEAAASTNLATGAGAVPFVAFGYDAMYDATP